MQKMSANFSVFELDLFSNAFCCCVTVWTKIWFSFLLQHNHCSMADCSENSTFNLIWATSTALTVDSNGLPSLASSCFLHLISLASPVSSPRWSKWDVNCNFLALVAADWHSACGIVKLRSWQLFCWWHFRSPQLQSQCSGLADFNEKHKFSCFPQMLFMFDVHEREKEKPKTKTTSSGKQKSETWKLKAAFVAVWPVKTQTVKRENSNREKWNNWSEKWKQSPWNVESHKHDNSHNFENIWWKHENHWSWQTSCFQPLQGWNEKSKNACTSVHTLAWRFAALDWHSSSCSHGAMCHVFTVLLLLQHSALWIHITLVRCSHLNHEGLSSNPAGFV